MGRQLFQIVMISSMQKISTEGESHTDAVGLGGRIRSGKVSLRRENSTRG